MVQLVSLECSLSIKRLLVESPFFQIPEISRVFVSDEFRDLVLSSKLKGFEFTEVWDSEFTVEKETGAEESVSC